MEDKTIMDLPSMDALSGLLINVFNSRAKEMPKKPITKIRPAYCKRVKPMLNPQNFNKTSSIYSGKNMDRQKIQ